ncbi:hypothetical protein [Caballeronia sp. TF1N1]|uniref:hypothetical protein n=1 Tax=Caballeronia sp. TF1N1 TaxID=2878153 RepID=UPI001FCFB7D4|nr:hypothetical protein [Caballeronia sp. TF1N1]
MPMPAGVNPLELSDEDFLKHAAEGDVLPSGSESQEANAETHHETPVAKTDSSEEAGAASTETKVETTETKVDLASTEVKPELNVASTQVDPSKQGANDVNVQPNSESKEVKKDVATVTTPEAKPAGEVKDGQDKSKVAETTDKSAESEGTIDYEAFYKRVMTPFKANGKTIELRNIDEAISLMQMGANYTRKMQDMAPHRKTLMMLENAQLMDPDRLSFLIDLNNGDPKAIQKLLKDKGVDPMSIDTSEDSNYLGGNHKVSDEEANFRSALSDVQSLEGGKATLQAINDTWDQASKDVLWSEPQVMSAIHQQRENGIYERISAEVSRQKTLGHVPADLPFIKAYKVVGDAMDAAGAFKDLVAQSPAVPAQKTPATTTAAVTPPEKKEPVATRVVTPKSAAANADAASAAAATRSAPREAKPFVNPLAMSDEEFMKQMHNRL